MKGKREEVEEVREKKKERSDRGLGDQMLVVREEEEGNKGVFAECALSEKERFLLYRMRLLAHLARPKADLERVRWVDLTR